MRLTWGKSQETAVPATCRGIQIYTAANMSVEVSALLVSARNIVRQVPDRCAAGPDTIPAAETPGCRYPLERSQIETTAIYGNNLVYYMGKIPGEPPSIPLYKLKQCTMVGSIQHTANMSDVVPASALLIFARTLVRSIPELTKKCGIDAKQLYDSLKPILLQKLTDAGIAIIGAVASVVQRGGKLIYSVATHPLFCVCLTAGIAVLGQLGLEKLGYRKTGRVFGATGMAIAGGLAGFILAPAALPVAVGALVGLSAWTAGDILRDNAVNIHIHIKDGTLY